MRMDLKAVETAILSALKGIDDLVIVIYQIL